MVQTAIQVSSEQYEIEIAMRRGGQALTRVWGGRVAKNLCNSGIGEA